MKTVKEEGKYMLREEMSIINLKILAVIGNKKPYSAVMHIQGEKY